MMLEVLDDLVAENGEVVWKFCEVWRLRFGVGSGAVLIGKAEMRCSLGARGRRLILPAV
jgi:hypothetical protein